MRRRALGHETGGFMRTSWYRALPVLLAPIVVSAQKPPLLPEHDVAALAQELSGETAKRNLEGLARFHRQRGSQGFHSAAELVAERARAYGLSDVAILQFPADGKIFYGTQRSRPAWDAEFAELWEVNKGGGGAQDQDRLSAKMASYEAEPIVLAEDSESADVAADLVDVGDGSKPSDYADKDVKGKIVLAAAQPGAVQDLAVGKFGAVGIVSYAQNQKTAWWGEDENLIRWGHLQTFSPNKTFGFMISLKTARALRERLSKGSQIKLHAVVKAGQHPGNYEVVTATIPGGDPKLKEEEIAFSCHLDHQRPGANDNASGCVTILEVARTLQKLIGNNTLTRPARTIRFIWPPEVEGTLALLNEKALPVVNIPRFSGTAGPSEAFHEHMKNQPPPAPTSAGSAMDRRSGPELAGRLRAVVHMDMVGGGPATKAVFHVTRGPMSLPSFIHAVAWAFAAFVNEQSYEFAATGNAGYPLVAPEGGKQPLLAQDSAFTMGSDHDVYQDSSFKIPAIYLNDWPDPYIHTNLDTAANIDPTKLKRAAFIGAASGYFLAGLAADQPHGYAALLPILYDDRNQQSAFRLHRVEQLPIAERQSALFLEMRHEREVFASTSHFVPTAATESDVANFFKMQERNSVADPGLVRPQPSGDALLKFSRVATPRGPVSVFGYDYVRDHQGNMVRPRLLDYEGLWGAGEEYAYETLNVADRTRNVQQIRDAVSAEYGPVPLELIVEYLRVLENSGVVEQVR
jgi:aminopeptidase YwaD